LKTLSKVEGERVREPRRSAGQARGEILFLSDF
jgi:hypothetical protein